jgi:hypothetical protein
MGYVEAVYSGLPTDISASGDSYDVDINLGDEYARALKAYMKFRAYSIDAAHSIQAAQRALSFWNLFLELIGRKDLIENRYDGQVNGGNSNPIPQ